MSLEVVREIQDWLRERAPFAEEKRDEQSADTSVAVKKRVDRLELRVGDSYLDEQRDVVILVQERLEVSKSRGHLLWRRRNKRGVCERRASRSNPVLSPSQFTGRQMRSPRPVEKLRVNLSNEPSRDGQSCQAGQSVIHRLHVVHHFIDIAWNLPRRDIGFGSEQILQRTLSSFYLAREHRFLTDVHVDKQLGVGEDVNRSVEPTERPVGVRQPALEFAGSRDRGIRRQRGWSERLISAGLNDILPSPTGIFVVCYV